MPAALLSRFDVLYVMMDRPNHDADTALARFVTHVHRTEGAPAPDHCAPDADLDVLRCVASCVCVCECTLMYIFERAM